MFSDTINESHNWVCDKSTETVEHRTPFNCKFKLLYQKNLYLYPSGKISSCSTLMYCSNRFQATFQRPTTYDTLSRVLKMGLLTCDYGPLDALTAPVWGPVWRLRGATLASGGASGGGNGGLIQDAAELAPLVKTCKNRFKSEEKKKRTKHSVRVSS